MIRFLMYIFIVNFNNYEFVVLFTIIAEVLAASDLTGVEIREKRDAQDVLHTLHSTFGMSGILCSRVTQTNLIV